MADSEVQTREIDFKALVLAAEGESFYEAPNAYEFQGGRIFKDKGSESAIYSDDEE